MELKSQIKLVFPKIYGEKNLNEVVAEMNLYNFSAEKIEEQFCNAVYIFLNNNIYFNSKYFWEKLKNDLEVPESFLLLFREEVYINLFNKNLQVKN